MGQAQQRAPRAPVGSIVVETISGGCGGVTREDRRFPEATGAQTTLMGQLQVLSGDAVVAVFEPGTWVTWHADGPGAP